MIVKRIDPVSAAKIAGIIAAAFGLIAGIVFFLFGAMFSAFPSQHGAGLGLFGGFMGMITLPIMFVLAPTLVASFYVSYRDVFTESKPASELSPEEPPAPPPEEPPANG